MRTALRFFEILRTTTHHVRVLRNIERSEGRVSNDRLHPEMQEWGRRVLEILSVRVKRIGEPLLHEPAIFVGNHISYLDVPLLISAAPVVFIAKKQIEKWPVFGAGFRIMGTLSVERNSQDSRKLAAEAVWSSISERKQSVAIFPSGTTCLGDEKPWRWGAFQIAARYGIPLQPFRIRYTPARRAAFLGDDNFVPHLWRLVRDGEIEATVEFSEPVKVSNPEASCNQWREWSQAFTERQP